MRTPLLLLGALACACGNKPAARDPDDKTPDPPGPELRDPREVHLGPLTQLTFGGENAEAYWSFDGTRLIFQTTREPYACDQIMTIPAGGGEAALVSTGQGRTTCAYYLPGDQDIIYSSTHEISSECPTPPDHSRGYVWGLFDYDIYRAAADGSNPVKLTDRPGYDAEATVCPVDGSIVFTSDRDGDLELYRMNADGSNVTRLTHSPGYDGGAFFNADCTQLVWRASRPEGEALADFQALLAQHLVRPTRMEIFVGPADGSEPRQITYLGAASFAPFFYPSGDRILFASNVGDPRGREFDLWAIDTDGTDLEQITFSPGFDSFPMFSPDGKRLAFASNRNQAEEGETNVFVADWIDAPPKVAAASIADRFDAHVGYLADDALAGRGVGTDGLTAAATYIEEQLREAGAEGGMADGKFRQGFEVTTEVRPVAGQNSLALNGAPVAADAFVPLSFSSNGAISGKATVYVGYGIVAKGIRDDYKGKKVKGKVVVVRRFTPEDGKFADEGLRQREGDLHRKAISAKRAGAVGMIVIDVPPPAKQQGDKPRAEEPLPRLDPSDSDLGIVAVAVSHEAGKALVDKTHKVAMAVELERVRAATDNVVGVVRAGSAVRAEGVVVIGAHYDHLGMGGAGSLSAEPGIHNGADDNASGVAALIETARLLAGSRDQLSRDVYLVAFSAEEMGVLGSNHFVRSRPFDQPIVAMLNMDMVGRMRDDVLHVIGGDSAAEWKGLVGPRCAELGLRCTIGGDGYGPSDHMPFFIDKVPVLHFFTGGHLDYHRPSDDPPTVNDAGGARTAELVAAVARDAAAAAALTYQPAKAPPVQVGDVRSRGASLGTIPAYTDEGPGAARGVLIQDVVPDGPAQKAGLQGGDRLLAVDGVELQTVHDLMYVLSNAQPGETAKLTYARDGKETTVTITFGKPRRR